MLRRVVHRRRQGHSRRNYDRRRRNTQQQRRSMQTTMRKTQRRRSFWTGVIVGTSLIGLYYYQTRRREIPLAIKEEDTTVLEDLENGQLTEQVKYMLEDLSECSKDTMKRDVVKVAKKYGVDKNNLWQFVTAVKTVASHLLPKPTLPSTRSDLTAAKALVVSAIVIAENLCDVSGAKATLQLLSLEFLLQRVAKLLSEPEVEKYALAPVLGKLKEVFDHPAYYDLDEPRTRALLLGCVEQLLPSLNNPLEEKNLLKKAIMVTNADISQGKKRRKTEKVVKSKKESEKTTLRTVIENLNTYLPFIEIVIDDNKEKEGTEERLKTEKELKSVAENVQTMRTSLMRHLLDLFSKRKEGKEALEFFKHVENETRVPRIILFEAWLINMRIAHSERDWDAINEQALHAFDLVNVIESEGPKPNSITVAKTFSQNRHDPLTLVPELLDTLLRLGKYQQAIAVGEELLKMNFARLTDVAVLSALGEANTISHVESSILHAETHSKIAYCYYLSGAREQALENCQDAIDALDALDESKCVKPRYRSLQADLVMLVDNLSSKNYHAATQRLQNIISIPEMEPRAVELAKSALKLVAMAKLADKKGDTGKNPQVYKHIVPEVVNQLPRFTFEEGIIYGDIANSSSDRQTTLGVLWALLHSDQERQLSPHEYRILQHRIMQSVENNKDGMEWLETYIKPLIPSEFNQDFEEELSLKKMTA